MSEKTILEACADAVGQTNIGESQGWITVLANGANVMVTRAVIQKIIDLTPSPRTVDELTRILNGGAVDGVGAGVTEDVERARDPYDFCNGQYRDARAWTDEYMRIHGDKPVDAEILFGWFANAIETQHFDKVGYDVDPAEPKVGGGDTKRAFTGEAVGAYAPGFFDRMNVLQMCGGDAIRAEMAWAWLNKTDAP